MSSSALDPNTEIATCRPQSTSRNLDSMPERLHSVPLVLQEPNAGSPNEQQGTHKSTRNERPSSSFLRSVGLKLFISRLFVHKQRSSRPDKKEKQKVVISQSRLIACTRTAAHILPVSITIFLVALNAGVLLNGPEITATAIFFLQVAAKLHELAIVGSLTIIALDLIRYHLLHEGISLGLLSSGLSIGSMSWLWTTDFVSGLKISMSFRAKLPSSRQSGILSLLSALVLSKISLFLILVSFTVLATTVGPASALLFIPTRLWIPSGSTGFYVAGTQDALWPATLNGSHAGPEFCSIAPLPLDVNVCLNGGWKTLAASLSLLSPIRPGFELYIPGGSAYQVPPARIITGAIPILGEGFPLGEPDTWAVTPHVALASLMDYLSHQAEIAIGYAKRRNKRLRDFGTTDLYITSDGKLPITRSVCSNLTEVRSPASEIPFPIVPGDKFWRERKLNGTGPVKLLNISRLGLADWNRLHFLNATTRRQARAKWLSVPEDLGTGTAAMIYLVQNSSITYARGCVIDARWAKGQIVRSYRSVMYSWEAQPGFQSLDRSSAEFVFQLAGMFDPNYTPHYEPIESTQAWLDALTPTMPEASAQGDNLTMNTFEALLNQTNLNDPGYVFDYWEDSGFLLEYVITIFFINALSRVGLSYQLANPRDIALNPDLWSRPIIGDSFISGKSIYNARDPSTPYFHANFKTFKYGTAWALGETGRYVAVAILCIHLFVAIVHTIILLCTKWSSEAWDSINELLVLAYNSMPRPGAFENCSSGIVLASTLEKKVRVGTRIQSNGDAQPELVLCSDEDGAGNIIAGKEYG